MNILWDADKYKQNFSFVHQYGSGVMELIDFAQAKTAIDLGCGNGALTAVLKEKGLSVTGLDASPEQLLIARQMYPEISFVQADATDFCLAEPVDLVFSNAVFHWIDRDRQSHMLQCVARALHPGGQFVFEMGGLGCVAKIHSALKGAFASFGYSYEIPNYFPGIGEYAPMVEQAGMRVKTALLFDRFTELKGPDGMYDWIEMFVKRPFAVIREETVREKIKQQAVAALRPDLFINGTWFADYVRLRMKAVK